MVLRIEDVVIRKVITIDSRSFITEATEVMHRYATSSLVVLSGKKIDGILSTRDVIARVVAKGLDPTTILVEDVMTSPVIMMRPDTPLGDAIKIMIQRKIKKLPLVTGEKNNARLVGLLSLTDLVEFHPYIFSTLWEQVLMTIPTIPEEGEFIVA
jgi:CBS domain-containing protein